MGSISSYTDFWMKKMPNGKRNSSPSPSDLANSSKYLTIMVSVRPNGSESSRNGTKKIITMERYNYKKLSRFRMGYTILHRTNHNGSVLPWLQRQRMLLPSHSIPFL